MQNVTRGVTLALLIVIALAMIGGQGLVSAQDGSDGIVSTVEGEPIPRAQFHARLVFVRWQYLHELDALYEATGGTLSLIPSTVNTLVDNLTDPVALGDEVLHLLEQERLLWQQGEALDVAPTAEDAQEQEAAFFSLWTNVPAENLATNAEAQAFIDDWYAGAQAASGMTPAEIRILFETEALRQRLYEHVTVNVPREEEAVHTRHILCAFHPDNAYTITPPTEEERAAAKNCAESVLIRLANGESFSTLAMELSDDLTSAQLGGDVGWTLFSYLVEPYAEAARDAALNTVVGPVETIYGYHVLEVLERELQELNDEEYASSKQGYFDLWVETLYAEANIQRSPDWDANLPTTPDLSSLDPEVQTAIDDFRAP